MSSSGRCDAKFKKVSRDKCNSYFISGGGEGSLESRTMVLDTTSLTWSLGGDLPRSTSRPGSVSTGGTVLLFGGHNETLALDQILQWNPDQETWTERPEKLSVARMFPAAVVINDDKVQC